MKRAMLVSLSLVVLGWISGCGAYNAGGGGNPTPNALKGQYAFVLGGYDSSDNRVAIAGSITADGLGKITAGEVDVNDNGTISTNNSLLGNYVFDSAGQSTLGTITLTTTVVGVPHPLAFGFSLQESGNFGQIMSLDTNNFMAAGTIQLQTPSVFSLSSLAADYAVTLNGTNGVNRTSAVGRFTLLGASGLSNNVSFDRSVAGFGTAGPTTTASVTFSTTEPDTNGRGKFTLNLNDGLPAATSMNFAYYVVTADRIAAVEIDTAGILTADISKQINTPLTVVTTGCVFGMSGLDTGQLDTGNNAEEATAVGQLAMTGTGSSAGTLHWDANDAGIIPGHTNSQNLAVTFDPTTGRGTVAVPGGNTAGLADKLVFYLYDAGKGFILDATASTVNRAMAGNFMPQTGAPFSTSDFGGLGIVRSVGASVLTEFSFVGLFGLTSTAGEYAILYDQRFPNSNATNGFETDLDQSFGLTVVTLDPTVGAGTLSIPNLNANPSTEAFYIIGPNEFRFIDISPLSSGVNGPSTLYYVSPR